MTFIQGANLHLAPNT